MEITKVTMKEVNDLSGRIYYSAVVNGKDLIQYSTDGFITEHLSLKQWVQVIKDRD